MPLSDEFLSKVGFVGWKILMILANKNLPLFALLWKDVCFAIKSFMYN